MPDKRTKRPKIAVQHSTESTEDPQNVHQAKNTPEENRKSLENSKMDLWKRSPSPKGRNRRKSDSAQSRGRVGIDHKVQ